MKKSLTVIKKLNPTHVESNMLQIKRHTKKTYISCVWEMQISVRDHI